MTEGVIAVDDPPAERAGAALSVRCGGPRSGPGYYECPKGEGRVGMLGSRLA
jgi:hypothetical protein